MPLIPADLIPDVYSDCVFASNEDDLLFLGKQNLLEFAATWKRRSNDYHHRLKYAQERVDLMKGKTALDFQALAKDYDNPEKFRVTCKSNGNYEPIDQESIDREYGTTTFNLCGWCKYVRGGLCRYGYYIEPSCLLIPKELGNGSGYGGTKKSQFNTKCILQNASDEFLKNCHIYLENELVELSAKIAKYEAFAKVLTDLSERAEEKPTFSIARGEDWGKPGDPAVCYCSPKLSNLKYWNTFLQGTLGEINGFITIHFSKKVHDGRAFDGFGFNVGHARPEIMLLKEYQYLRSHPDYRKVWLRAAKFDLLDCDTEVLNSALDRDALRTP